MTVESHTASVIQFPINPDSSLETDGRQCDVTVTFEMADMETLWQTAQERGVTLPEMIQQAALMDAFR